MKLASILLYFELDSSYLTGRQVYFPEVSATLWHPTPSARYTIHCRVLLSLRTKNITTEHQEALLHFHPGYQSKNGQALHQGEERLLASFQESRERRASPRLRYFLLNLPPTFRGRSTILPPCCSGATTSLPSFAFPARTSCKQAFRFTAQNISRTCQRDRQNTGRWHETDGWCRRSVIVHDLLRAYTTYGATIWDLEKHDRSDYESIVQPWCPRGTRSRG